jgi:hypothetical protein
MGMNQYKTKKSIFKPRQDQLSSQSQQLEESSSSRLRDQNADEDEDGELDRDVLYPVHPSEIYPPVFYYPFLMGQSASDGLVDHAHKGGRLDDVIVDNDNNKELDAQALREDLALDVLEEEMDWKLDELHEQHLWRLVEKDKGGDSKRLGHNRSSDEEEIEEEEDEEEQVGGDSDDWAGPRDLDMKSIQFRYRPSRRKEVKRGISEHILRFKPMGYAGFKSQPFIFSDEENEGMDESE